MNFFTSWRSFQLLTEGSVSSYNSDYPLKFPSIANFPPTEAWVPTAAAAWSQYGELFSGFQQLHSGRQANWNKCQGLPFMSFKFPVVFHPSDDSHMVLWGRNIRMVLTSSRGENVGLPITCKPVKINESHCLLDMEMPFRSGLPTWYVSLRSVLMLWLVFTFYFYSNHMLVQEVMFRAYIRMVPGSNLAGTRTTLTVVFRSFLRFHRNAGTFP